MFSLPLLSMFDTVQRPTDRFLRAGHSGCWAAHQLGGSAWPWPFFQGIEMGNSSNEMLGSELHCMIYCMCVYGKYSIYIYIYIHMYNIYYTCVMGKCMCINIIIKNNNNNNANAWYTLIYISRQNRSSPNPPVDSRMVYHATFRGKTLSWCSWKSKPNNQKWPLSFLFTSEESLH